MVEPLIVDLEFTVSIVACKTRKNILRLYPSSTRDAVISHTNTSISIDSTCQRFVQLRSIVVDN